MPSWGMILEPKKRYKQNVQNAYQITHAVLDLESAGGKGQHSDVLMTIGDNTFILCTLSTVTPQTQLNMRLAQGDQISFATRGEGTIHLTGYILEAASTALVATNGQLASGDSKKAAKNQKNSQKKDDLRRLLEKTISDEEDDESDDADFSELMRSMDGLEEDNEDDVSGEEEEDDDEMGDDSEDDDDEDDDDSELGEEEEDDDDDDDEEEEEEEVIEPPTKKGKKEQQQQQQKKQQEQKPTKQQEKKDKKEKPAAAAAAQTNGVAKDGKVQTLNGGVKIKDLKEGSGAFAKPGKNVVVYYEGRLQSNNKMFDSCKQGAGFKFQLGRGTVIRGWDVGVAGMRVGGKRQITCPPGAAYGQRGSPPVIPPNSTLVFDVELRNVQ